MAYICDKYKPELLGKTPAERAKVEELANNVHADMLKITMK